MPKKKRTGSKQAATARSMAAAGGRGHPHSPELRRRVVEQVVEGGATMTGIASAFRLSVRTVSEWVRR